MNLALSSWERTVSFSLGTESGLLHLISCFYVWLGLCWFHLTGFQSSFRPSGRFPIVVVFLCRASCHSGVTLEWGFVSCHCCHQCNGFCFYQITSVDKGAVLVLSTDSILFFAGLRVSCLLVELKARVTELRCRLSRTETYSVVYFITLYKMRAELGSEVIEALIELIGLQLHIDNTTNACVLYYIISVHSSPELYAAYLSFSTTPELLSIYCYAQ